MCNNIKKDFKYYIGITVVKWFKAFPLLGRFRFWCLYFAYALTGWHIRHREWDFVLGYLPKLGKWQKVRILDVGCSRSLFCHEVIYRGYELEGVDLEVPDFKYPSKFIKSDIRNYFIFERYDFITCISVLEHIEHRKADALLSMVDSLKIGGRLLLTIPTEEFAQGHEWHGFTYKSISNLMPDNARIIEYTERAGQLCLAIERLS